MNVTENRWWIGPLFAMTLGVATSGCASITVHSDPAINPGPYVGTRLAIKEAKRSWMTPRFYGEPLFTMCDVPLSFAADTVLLPLNFLPKERK